MNRHPEFLDPAYALRFLAILLLSNAISGTGLLANELQEIRLTRLRDLENHCPMVPPDNKEAWERRADELRLQVRIALGIHPVPTLASPQATIHGRRDMDGYSIEKVYFESLPGFYVTGSLYRPQSKVPSNTSEKYPLVLLPHGHWEEGRFYNASPDEVSKLLATGAERFVNAAINHMQAQCVQLARMGMVVFQYDMIGYADSKQISFDLAHRFGINDANVAPTEQGWRFFSTKAEGYHQSILGLQTINTIQAINVIGSLSDVDADRIAITGASGGGTQAFLAIAIEPRISGAFPAVMVSTGMQGGCTCENACNLRIGTGNIELAALAAPRPLGLTAADDWTRHVATDGLPELKKVYGLYGKPENVTLFSATQFPHNYNHLSRVAMYSWVNRLFKLGLSEPILERNFELLNKPELTVWDSQHLAPMGGPAFESRLLKAWGADIDKSVALEAPRSIVDGWRTMTQPTLTIADSLKGETEARIDRNETDYILRNQEGIIVARARSVGSKPLNESSANDRLEVRIVSQLGAEWTSTLISGDFVVDVVIADPVIADSTSLGEQPLVSNPRPSAAYTFGYNPAQLIRKAGVFLALSRHLSHFSPAPQDVVAESEGLFLALCAKLQEPQTIKQIYSNDNKEVMEVSAASSFPPKFLLEADTIRDRNFLPGSLRYDGIRGLLQAINQSK